MEQRSWAFCLRLLEEILPWRREAHWGHIWLRLSVNMVEVWEVAPGELRGPCLAYWSRIHTSHLKSALVGACTAESSRHRGSGLCPRPRLTV